MRTPTPRGPLSQWVRDRLTSPVQSLSAVDAPPPVTVTVTPHDSLGDLDLQTALWTCYELHHSGFEDVEDSREWDPAVIDFRRSLEAIFEEGVRRACAPLLHRAGDRDVATELFSLVLEPRGSTLTRHLRRNATLEEVQDFMRQRSIYHLKESDPQSFLLPRLHGRAKVALAELQYDEYGGGRPERLHQALFARALEACGLDSDPGAYLDTADATTLASTNVMNLFALNRRLRGAAVGHLAAFKATSSLPCRDVAAGMRRLGLPEAAAEYYDEHVEADAVHEQLAARDICGALVEEHPELREDVLFGAAACVVLDSLNARTMLERWNALEPAGVRA